MSSLHTTISADVHRLLSAARYFVLFRSKPTPCRQVLAVHTDRANWLQGHALTIDADDPAQPELVAEGWGLRRARVAEMLTAGAELTTNAAVALDFLGI